MAGNHLHVDRKLRHNFLQRGDHSFDAASATQIDKRKSVCNKIVSHVHYIRLGKENHAIAVGVAAGKMQCANIFSVQMHGEIMIERDDGQSFLRLGRGLERDSPLVARRAALFEPFAHIVMRKNRRVMLEVRIPACVIFVIMRIDDEAHWLVSDRLQRGTNLFRQWSVLIINDDDAILANRRADIPARSLQQINVAGNLADLDLNFAEILVLSDEQGGGSYQSKREQTKLAHKGSFG